MTKNPALDFCVFCFCFAIVIGGAYNLYVSFDFSYAIDAQSYMKMAANNYDVTVTHRYRVIIPFLAGSLANILDFVYPIIWKTRDGHEWSIRLSFFIVNSIFLSLAGLLIYKICRFQKGSLFAAVIAVIAFLSSRWAFYIAGLPLIDSLYLLVVFAFIYGILADNQWLVGFSLLAGPLAKESFILFLPLIFYFNRKYWILTSIECVAGLCLFVAIRTYIYSTHQFSTELGSVQNAFNHFENILYSITRIVSFKGVFEVFFTFGIFNLLVVYRYLGKTKPRTDISLILYLILPIVVIHILLSGDVGRMLYLSAPYFCVEIALGFDMAMEKLNLEA